MKEWKTNQELVFSQRTFPALFHEAHSSLEFPVTSEARFRSHSSRDGGGIVALTLRIAAAMVEYHRMYCM